ncbi:MAG: hypothetical protein LUC30_01260 [Clostridiales bacterium]|nr:hypothetical protein [Clostridiales bacterium]
MKLTAEAIKFFGKMIAVSFVDGDRPVKGRCIAINSAADNEPDPASITVSLSENGGILIFEDEIDHIDIVE